eukprot:1069703-Lingulodinium_polyedra.AAC.1
MQKGGSQRKRTRNMPPSNGKPAARNHEQARLRATVTTKRASLKMLAKLSKLCKMGLTYALRTNPTSSGHLPM